MGSENSKEKPRDKTVQELLDERDAAMIERERQILAQQHGKARGSGTLQLAAKMHAESPKPSLQERQSVSAVNQLHQRALARANSVGTPKVGTPHTRGGAGLPPPHAGKGPITTPSNAGTPKQLPPRGASQELNLRKTLERLDVSGTGFPVKRSAASPKVSASSPFSRQAAHCHEQPSPGVARAPPINCHAAEESEVPRTGYKEPFGMRASGPASKSPVAQFARDASPSGLHGAHSFDSRRSQSSVGRPTPSAESSPSVQVMRNVIRSAESSPLAQLSSPSAAAMNLSASQQAAILLARQQKTNSMKRDSEMARGSSSSDQLVKKRSWKRQMSGGPAGLRRQTSPGTDEGTSGAASGLPPMPPTASAFIQDSPKKRHSVAKPPMPSPALPYPAPVGASGSSGYVSAESPRVATESAGGRRGSGDGTAALTPGGRRGSFEGNTLKIQPRTSYTTGGAMPTSPRRLSVEGSPRAGISPNASPRNFGASSPPRSAEHGSPPRPPPAAAPSPSARGRATPRLSTKTPRSSSPPTSRFSPRFTPDPGGAPGTVAGSFTPRTPQSPPSYETRVKSSQAMAAWDIIKHNQIYHDVNLVDVAQTPVKPEGTIRVVMISDTHNYHQNDFLVPDGDILLHCGDFSMIGQVNEIAAFSMWFEALPHKHKVCIAGNHDGVTLEAKFLESLGHDLSERDIARSWLLNKNFIYLEDQGVEIMGLRIYGTPWSPTFFHWGFMKDRGDEIREAWDLIPDETDILMVHGPPMGRGDFTQHGIRAGCEDLLNAVQQRVKPKICCFGHIHEGHGASSDGVTTFVNCAICDVGKFPLHSYSPVQPAIVIDLPDPRVSDNDETNEVSQGDAAATSLPRRSFTGRRVTAAQHVVPDASAQQVDEPLESDISMEVDVEVSEPEPATSSDPSAAESSGMDQS